MTIRSDIAKSITAKAFRLHLSNVVNDLGGVTSAARAWGVPYQRVSNAIHGEKLPSKGILKAVGFEPVKTIKYRYKKVNK